MGQRTDERGRLHLPARIRDRYGDTYHIVELPSRVVLLPIDDDPIQGVHEAVGAAFNDRTRAEMKDDALDEAERDVSSSN